MMAKKANLDKSQIGYYILSLPSKDIAQLCVIHLMRHLTNQHMTSTIEEAAKESQLMEHNVDFMANDCKI